MSNIRVMCILNTTNDADTLENNIRDSVSALHEYCYRFHTGLDEQHKGTIEIHKVPRVPAIHMSMRASRNSMRLTPRIKQSWMSFTPGMLSLSTSEAAVG